mgnify:CR=1 FL=1
MHHSTYLSLLAVERLSTDPSVFLLYRKLTLLTSPLPALSLDSPNSLFSFHLSSPFVSLERHVLRLANPDTLPILELDREQLSTLPVPSELLYLTSAIP